MDDRIFGMFYGHAIGDALGSGYEFDQKLLENFIGIINVPVHFNNRFHGKKIGAIGQVTDDMEMTMELCNSINRMNGYNRNDVLKSYMEFTTYCSFLGRNTKDLFKGVKTIKGYETRWDKIFGQTEESEWTQSNGCLMRASPLIFCSRKDAIVDCSLSNPHPYCIESVVVYVYMLKKIIRQDLDYDKFKAYCEIHAESIYRFCRDAAKEGMKNEFSPDIKLDEKKQKGWVFYALYCAIFVAFAPFKTFSDGVNFIIKMGGDTDTNGCIAGAVLGARFGKKNMMKEKPTKTNIKIIMECDFVGDYPREEEKHFKTFIRNIERMWSDQEIV